MAPAVGRGQIEVCEFWQLFVQSIPTTRQGKGSAGLHGHDMEEARHRGG